MKHVLLENGIAVKIILAVNVVMPTTHNLVMCQRMNHNVSQPFLAETILRFLIRNHNALARYTIIADVECKPFWMMLCIFPTKIHSFFKPVFLLVSMTGYKNQQTEHATAEEMQSLCHFQNIFQSYRSKIRIVHETTKQKAFFSSFSNPYFSYSCASTMLLK